jgi:copper chaperone CopZ
MSCAGCERSVARALGRIAGASDARADASTGRAWVRLDPARAEEARLAVTRAGFTVAGVGLAAEAPLP